MNIRKSQYSVEFSEIGARMGGVLSHGITSLARLGRLNSTSPPLSRYKRLVKR